MSDHSTKVFDSIRKIFMGHENRNRTAAAQLDLSDNTKRFLRELFGESIGSPSADKKLDAIIEMLRAQAGVAADLARVKDELGIIHGLLLGAAPSQELIDQMTNEIDASTDKVEDAIKQQTKGDK